MADFENMFSVKGKTALVTGSSRGIGEMMAAGLLAQGVKVYINSRKAERCRATANRLSQTYGGECIAIPADLSNIAGIEALCAQLKERESKLDILINNAGASWGAEIDEFPEIGWDKVMDINVKGVFFLTQRLLPELRAAASAEDPARIINVGSIDGIRNAEFESYSYGASKAAVHHLTKFLATRLVGENINCNVIAPGPYPTVMLAAGVFDGDANGDDWESIAAQIPIGRVGRPEDIAGLATFLCSPAGSFIVGQVIASDGGIVGTL